MPTFLAASTISVPSGTLTGCPSILRLHVLPSAPYLFCRLMAVGFAIPLEIRTELFDTRHRPTWSKTHPAGTGICPGSGAATFLSRSMSPGLACPATMRSAMCVHPIGAFPAGSAFAARFVLEEMGGLVDQPGHVDALVQDDHRGRAKRGAQLALDRFVIHRAVQGLVVGHDHGGGRPGRHDGLDLAPVRDAAAVGRRSAGGRWCPGAARSCPAG